MTKLSELANKYFVEVIIDGEFKSLGLISYNSSDMLVFLENRKYLAPLLHNPKIVCVITSKQFVDDLSAQFGIVVSDCPRKTFYDFHNLLKKDAEFYWKSFSTNISETAKIHSTAYIADCDVYIGHNTIIEENVTILERVIIKDNVIVRAGSIIGSEGFGFNRIDNDIISVSHAGGVILHDGVEVQSNCCIDKSVFGGFTEIGENTKIDNMVHIAHNVQIGKRCLLAACAMIAGSVTVGDDVWIGPSASISSEVEIGDGASITIGSVVSKNVTPGQRVTGNFAIEHKKFIEFIRTIR